ncbi:hypothetical protein AAFC00_001442 [Neodothiora populina]|uniref:Uncharacterized protein n=1 Tax=Neodothiora populina TaxID=2781224 RepID=A0ABR3PNV9_9PEZI
MSSDSLALFRKSMGDDLGKLADHHFRDLKPEDRDTLRSAAKKVSTYTTVGSMIGVGLGLFLAYRVRANRNAVFQAFRAAEKPTHVQFAGGRTEPLPDLTPMLKPTTIGDFAAYTLFATGGLFFGGELGLLTGSAAAGRTITRDPEARQRIDTEFRKFRAEVLRAEAASLESGDSHFASRSGL